MRFRSPQFALSVLLFLTLPLALSSVSAADANPLDRELGRADVLVTTAPFSLAPRGLTAEQLALVPRLEQLGYRRVRGRRPAAPGQFFWGTKRFWIHRRGFLDDGDWRPARLIELRLTADGEIAAIADAEGDPVDDREAVLEPRVLAESLHGRRAPRILVEFEELPEVVRQAVVASEDGRFFEHGGIDSRGVARALLANLRRGEVAQGGSTITQQLIKLRDLTPKRSLGRKVSEAVRALALESEVEKRHILEDYLNRAYFGTVDGVSVYGIGAAARAFYSRSVPELGLAEACMLAGLLQAPNRLSPIRHPERAIERRDYVLDRLEDLGRVDADRLQRVRDRRAPRLRLTTPDPEVHASLQAALRAEAGHRVLERLAEGRGVVIVTSLDAHLQEQAELLVERAAGSGLQGALVAADAREGRVLAYVGAAGDRDELDRVRRARRQPGSTVKPLVALEALESCGGEDRLTLASLVRDAPVRIDLPGGAWTPRNSDLVSHGVVDVRRVLTDSLNQATVRLARHCGFGAVERRFEELGLEGVDDEAPAFVLGASETSPFELLQVYSRLAPAKRVRLPRRVIARITLPSGNVVRDRRDLRRRARHVPKPDVRFLVRDALGDAARASGVGVAGAWGKTGTSSQRRDAWFAGGVGDWVAVGWLGRDDAAPTRRSGAEAAAPMLDAWFRIAAPLARTADSRGDALSARERLIEREIDGDTGLILHEPRRGSRSEWFLRGTLPKKKRWWRPGATADIVD